MKIRTSRGRNARILRGISLLYLGAIIVALLLVHSASYGPAVSYVPLYLVLSVIFTTAVALLLLPPRQFNEGFCVAFYVFYAIFLAAAAFFTGGVSSELYVLFFPLVFASAMHGSWRMGLLAQGAVLISYFSAMLPNVLGGIKVTGGSVLIFFRLLVFALTGAFALATVKATASAEEGYALDEDGSVLLQRVLEEIEARRGAQVGVILVDPGRRVEDVNLLMERVGARIGEPILLGEGAVFGVVLSGVDDRTIESAARRALAAASSLGSRETRAGAAIYPRDARSAEDLLVAAGSALEAAFDLESSSTIVLAGRDITGAEPSYRAAP
ncbi:MAG: hypothetical protein JOZ19_15430 [Rubrobacter sp.]|nr:hypothetical protein [Rubrobacter sp.]